MRAVIVEEPLTSNLERTPRSTPTTATTYCQDSYPDAKMAGLPHNSARPTNNPPQLGSHDCAS